MGWYVYLLRCADGSLYAGITTDLRRRLDEHNRGRAGAKYTRARRPVGLAWSEPAADRATASRREYAVRHMDRAAKERLIAQAAMPGDRVADAHAPPPDRSSTGDAA